MVEQINTGQSLIHQILLKPADDMVLNDQEQLSAEYIRGLQDSLQFAVQLNYIRAMSGGVHVLGIEPGLNRNDVSILTAQLTTDARVEYAEPDFPRRRR